MEDTTAIPTPATNTTDLVLTTVDNPFSPKTDYDKWKQWDEDNGYNTEAFVARLVSMEDGFDIDNDVLLNELTDKVVYEILDNDVANMYTLV